jgi:adenosylmethionine-8-amino-7-oxononanoate aminotransferase
MIEAISSALQSQAVYHLFEPFSNEWAVRAAGMIAARSPHPDGRVFLACSGSEAIDSAIKFVRLFHQRRGDHDRQVIIRRTHGYHGTNLGGTSMQGIAANRTGWGDLLPHVVEVPNDDIEAAASMFAEHGERVAAVIAEPVQGAGGVWPPAPGYLEGLRRLCDQHGALLVFDEVICGFGRTGSWFGAQTFGVTPDLLTFAKGVTSGYQPLSGVVLSAPVAEQLAEPGFLLRHGYTYSGHPMAAAAAVANIELIEAEGLVERAHHIGRRTGEGLAALAADETIASYRGLAGVWAADLGRDATEVKGRMLDAGVIVRGLGDAIIWCPPLVVTDDQIGRFIETLAAALH